MENKMNKKELILNAIDDLASNFLYYDRKEDEDLENGDIETAVETNVITIDEMVNHFKTHLENTIQ
jgi:hypothetical protein